MTNEFDAIAYVDAMAGRALTGLLASPEGVGSMKETVAESYDYAYAMLDEKLRRTNPPVENP